MQDQKYIQLKERMHAFLMRKDVMAVLRPPPPVPDSSSHIKSHSAQLQAQLDSPAPKQQDLPKHRKVEKILHTARAESAAAVVNAHADIKLQNEHLRRRLEGRKERSASMTRGERVETEGHDGEGEEEDRKPRVCYEDELERLVEELVRKRQRERYELEEKYSSQIQEMEGYCKGGNNPLIVKVIEELNRARDQEMAALETQITQERTKAIAELKAKYMRQGY